MFTNSNSFSPTNIHQEKSKSRLNIILVVIILTGSFLLLIALFILYRSLIRKKLNIHPEPEP
jgi:hypothetical protein